MLLRKRKPPFFAGEEEAAVCPDRRVRIDVKEAFLHDVRLVFPDSGVESHRLAVQVGNVHAVFVDDVDRADAGADQRLRRVSADAAEAEDRDAGCFQAFHRLIAEEASRSVELVHRVSFLP